MNHKQSTVFAFSLITSLFFLWGYISDTTGNIQYSYIVPLCYL